MSVRLIRLKRATLLDFIAKDLIFDPVGRKVGDHTKDQRQSKKE
ncbi:MAG: hypothetical protein NTW94_01045 [Legionellales bacterium]|nr:hypothetical protein [Legionellales bacterium]